MKLRMLNHAADWSKFAHQKMRERDLPRYYDSLVDDAPDLAPDRTLLSLPDDDFDDAVGNASAGADAPATGPADADGNASAGADAPATGPADASDSMRLRRWRR